MGFNCGIVGLPNVGKSTLFNALTETAAAEAANYPFCTIEPNTGRVAVPDLRLDQLASLAGSATIIPTQLEFVDIAGLVRGASKGEGLGNQFLANIREVDAIAHVLRCFDDSEITHVDGSVDPLRDAATVETELMLSDIESLERRMAALVKKTRGGDADAKRDLALMEKLFHQRQIPFGIGVTATCFLYQRRHAPFQRFDIGKHQFCFYRCRIAQRVNRTIDMGDFAVIKTAQHMGNGIHLANIGEELVAKPFAFRGTAHKAGNINEFQLRRNDCGGSGKAGQLVKTQVGNGNAAGIRLNRAERIIGRFGGGSFGQCVEQG